MIDAREVRELLVEALANSSKQEKVSWPGHTDPKWDTRQALDAIWVQIDYHGLAVLLHSRPSTISQWPKPLRERIAEDARLVSLWETTHRSVLAEVIERLSKAGIDTVLMKGTALAYTLYSDPAARRRGDSDLLVKPGNLVQARDILGALGWKKNDELHGICFQETWLLEASGGLQHAIDLHWQVSDRPVLQKILVVDDFFKRKTQLPRLSKYALACDPMLLLVHGALNQKWHSTHGYWTDAGRIKGSTRLIWTIDFDQLARSFNRRDWDSLVQFCEETQIGPLVAEALVETSETLHSPVPRHHLARLAKVPLSADVAEYLKATNSIDELWLDLRTASSWNQRTDILRNRVWVSRAHLDCKFPNYTHWPSALLYARLLLGAGSKIVRRLMRL